MSKSKTLLTRVTVRIFQKLSDFLPHHTAHLGLFDIQIVTISKQE